MGKEIYQSMTDIEHVLKKSSMYIGDSSKKERKEWVFDSGTKTMVKRELNYSSGLLKIFDEIISNTQDVFNKYNNKVKNVKVSINNNIIQVYNDGPTIPIEKMVGEEDIYIITKMFGNLRSSSNYSNTDQETIGTFGIGAKATNIFSNFFQVKCCNSEENKIFTQRWKNNMTEVEDPVIKSMTKKKSFTIISFEPDLKRFETSSLNEDDDEDIILMFKKRLIDLAATCLGLSVHFNEEHFIFKTHLEYIKLFSETNIISETTDDYTFAIIHDVKEGDQISFVNGNITKSGIHINNFLNILSKIIKEKLEKKKIKTNININNLLKQKIFLFINCRVKNPKYDSQTKDKLVDGEVPSFVLSKKTIKQINKINFVKEVVTDVINKEEKNVLSKTNKKNDLRSIYKLNDAQSAGTKESNKCTLILTEGDSAKTIAISGLKIIGRKYYGVFPLKGKLLNTRNASVKQISLNSEIKSLMSIIGLDIKKKYTDTNSLRYGRIMLMTDQDQDGSHIKGLIINFIHSYWPELLKINFFCEFITPIVKATKGSDVKEFFNMIEFNNWYEKNKTSKYYIKYYKGLGTSTDKEAEKYFKNYENHVIDFKYKKGDDVEILKAFDKKLTNERKEWLQSFMDKDVCTKDDVLYNQKAGRKEISFNEFVNKELVHFSNADNIRSIPNIIDGFKPGQRKVMHVVFTMNFIKRPEIKVEQLAGHVSVKSAYHHGEDSLKLTIINLANDYIGSNNINFLNPKGQFGSRLQGGKDRGSPRYIYTNLLPITRKIFIKEDEPILNYLVEENQTIEPDYFIPIVPTILINGARGIGTGWSTNIPSFNILDIMDYIKLSLENKDLSDFVFQPWYNKFIGQIFKINKTSFIITGNVSINTEEEKIIISELPIGLWTDNFKKKILDNDEIDFKEYNTKDSVLFVIKFKDSNLFQYLLNKVNGFYLYFKIVSKIKTNSLIAFNHKKKLTTYKNPNEIIDEFIIVRKEAYNKRKEYLINKIEKIVDVLTNKIKFINNIIDDKINIFKKPKKKIVEILKENDFKPDSDISLSENNKFDYLIKMSIENFTIEKIKELEIKKEELEKELKDLKLKTIENIWIGELEELKNYYLKTRKERKRKDVDNFEFLEYVKTSEEDVQEIKYFDDDSDF